MDRSDRHRPSIQATGPSDSLHKSFLDQTSHQVTPGPDLEDTIRTRGSERGSIGLRRAVRGVGGARDGTGRHGECAAVRRCSGPGPWHGSMDGGISRKSRRYRGRPYTGSSVNFTAQWSYMAMWTPSFGDRVQTVQIQQPSLLITFG